MKPKFSILWREARSKFAQDIFWNMVSLAVVAFSGLTINALILGKSGSAAVGVFNLVYTIYFVVSQLAVGGVHNSVLSYGSRNGGRMNEVGVIMYSALLLSSGLSLLVALLMALATPLTSFCYGDEVARGVLWTLPGLLLFSANKIYFMLFNAQRHMKVMAVLQAVRAVMILLWVAILLFSIGETRPSLLMAGFSVAEIPVLLFGFFYQRFRLPLPKTARRRGRWSVWLRRHWDFGWRGCLSGVLVGANSHLDILMLGLFFRGQLAAVGIYSFAAMYADGYSQLILLLRRQLDPYWGEGLAKRDIAGLNRLARKVKLYFYPVMLAAGLLGIAVFPLLLRILKPEMDIWPGSIVFAILAAGYVAIGPYKSFIGILLQGKRPGSYTLLMASTLLSNALFNLLLIRWFGIYGAAIATVISYLIQSILLTVLARKFFGVRL